MNAKIALRALASLLTGLAISWAGASAQQPPSAEAMLGAKIAHFELSGQTMHDGVSELSLQRIPLALGFEQTLNTTYSRRDVPAVRFDLRLQNATVRQVLDALCARDPRYTWSVDGRTINIYPVATIGDRAYLLNRRIPLLKLVAITRPDQGLFALPKVLPPSDNQVAVAGIGGDDRYPPPPWTVTLDGLTVRQIVNRLAEHMGSRSVWILSGSKDFRAFFFNKYGLGPEPRKDSGPR